MSNNLLTRFSSLPDLHQNPLFAQAMQDNGWTILGPEGALFFYKKLGPVGIAKIQHSNNIDLDWINHNRRQHHLITTFIEPGLIQKDIGQIGLKSEPFANSATSLVDLELTSTQLLKSFKSKTRYNISYSQRKKQLHVVTKQFSQLTPADYSLFIQLKNDWIKRKKIVCYEEKFFKSLLHRFIHSGWIHFAYHQNDCLAALMILKNHQTAIYYAAFSTETGYSLFAPTLITWIAMLTAKNDGCHIFDFGGIYDPRYRFYKKWQGFTKFKEGFSPTVVYYPPTRLLLGW